MSQRFHWLFFLALAAIPALPMGTDRGFVLLLLTRAIIAAIAAIGLAFIVGAGGLISFGHAAFVAIGAYTVAMLDVAGYNFLPAVLPAALIAGALFAAATGAVALRTRGVNFIMITLAFAQMVFFTLGSLDSYGGDDGYTLAARSAMLGWQPLRTPAGIYLTSLLALAACYFLSRTLIASRFGRILRALRQNRARVQTLGFNVFAMELTAYTIAGAIAALSGVLLANATEFVVPAYASWQRSGEFLVMVILGGAARASGAPMGAIIGAFAVVLAEEGLARVTEHWRLIFGPALVLAVLLARRPTA